MKRHRIAAAVAVILGFGSFIGATGSPAKAAAKQAFGFNASLIPVSPEAAQRK